MRASCINECMNDSHLNRSTSMRGAVRKQKGKHHSVVPIRTERLKIALINKSLKTVLRNSKFLFNLKPMNSPVLHLQKYNSTPALGLVLRPMRIAVL